MAQDASAHFPSPSSDCLPKQDRRLEGKVAIITGGASGIGEAAVRLFGQSGATVVVADIQDDLGGRLCRSLGPSFLYSHCDVSKEEDVSAVVDLAVSRFGKLDIMFSNAGILGANLNEKIHEMDMADFDKVISVNVRGTALAIKHAARVMIPARKGSILCTSSLASVMAGMSPHAYTTSKHAILGLSKTAASDLGKYGIRVNCVSPFGVATPMLVGAMRAASNNSSMTEKDVEEFRDAHANLQEGRKLCAMDVARAALFLVSEEDAGYISGLNLLIDGGLSITNHAFGMHR